MVQNPRKELVRLVAILCVVAIGLSIHKSLKKYNPRKIKVGLAKIVAATPRAQREEKRLYFIFDISDPLAKRDTIFQSMQALDFNTLTGMVGKTVPIMYDSFDHSYKWVLFRASEYKRYRVKLTDSSITY